MEPVFDRKKFQELVLYVAQRSEGDPRFGATKLNKLLYYMDFGSYRILGSPITGATYQHLPNGPDPCEMLPMKRSLIDSGSVGIKYQEYFTGTQERLVPLRDPDTSLFAPQEMELVNQVIAEFWDLDARRITNYAHQEFAWRATEDLEDIPYQSAWVSSEPLTLDQVEVGRELAAKLGLLKS